MDTVSYALSKKYANQVVGTGIISGIFVSPNIFRFTLSNNSTVNITVTGFNNFSNTEKTKLASLDETILSKFSYLNGKLLFDNSPLEGGTVDLTNYYNKLEVDNLLLNKVNVDGTKVLSENDYTDIEKNKLALTETKANTIETNLNNHINDKNNPHQVSMGKIIDNNIASPTDGQGLFYNSVTSKWENKTTLTTDEKVKLTALSTTGEYLGNLIDNSTIQISNNKIVAKSLDGQVVTLSELNYISGLDENIMTKFSNFVNGGIEVYNSGVFPTYADLLAFNFTTLSVGKTYLMYVATDENHDSHGTTYMANSTTNNTTQLPYYSGLSSATQRVLSVDKVDLTNEVKNKLSQTNIDMTDIIKTTDLTNNYTTTTDLQTNYALKSDLTGKANSSDVYNKTNTDSLLANKVDKVVGKSLIDDIEATRLSTVTNYDHTNVDTHMANNDIHVTTAEKTILSNTSGTNTGDENTSTIKTKLGQANSTTDGYMSSIDWNTFNNKQNKIFIQNTQPAIAIDNIWVDNTNPITYVLKVCDGTSYVQVGNSTSGSVQEIVIQNTQPSDTTIKLWLDTSSSPILKWYNGSEWISIGSSSGHVIKDNTTTFTQRKNLKFTGAVNITDDLANDSTVVNFGGTVSNPVEPKESIALADGQDTYEVINHTVGTKYMFILVDGVRIPYVDYIDLDSTHIQLKTNIATDIKKDMVITSFTTIIETVLINDTTLNGGTF